MDVSDKCRDPDTIGRIMALEQKMRGIYGRVSALEIRFSRGPADDTEFIPGERYRESDTHIEYRVAALESALKEKERPLSARKASMLDITGVVIGLFTIAVGVMLATESTGLLKNPALALAAGVIILACAVGRLLIK